MMTTALLPDRIILVAPFALPFVHDPRRISSDGISSIRAGLLAALDESERHRWTNSTASRRRFNDFSATLAEQLRDASPQWVLRREPTSLLAEVRAALPAHPIKASVQGHPLTLDLEGAQLGLMEFGFGSLTLDLRVNPLGEHSHADEDVAAPALEDSAAIMSVLDELGGVVQRDVAKLADLVPGGRGLQEHLGLLAPEEGEVECLWGHVVYGFDGIDDWQSIEEYYRACVPTADLGERCVVPVRGSTFVPGLGASLLVGRSDDREPVGTVMALAQAFYAATANLERSLTVLAAETTNALDVTQVHDLIETVSHFSGRLRTLDVHLAASTAAEARIWAGLTQVWRLDRQREEIHQRLDQLREHADHSIAAASQRSERRLTIVALVFTVITVISTFFDVIEFGQGEALQRPDVLRTVIELVLVAVLAGTTGWLWHRSRQPSPTEMRGHRG